MKTQKNIYIPGQRLKDLRKMKGITQGQVAEMLCYADENYISLIETGNRRLTQEKARILAQNYPDVSLAWLMGDSEYMNEMQRALSLIQTAKDEGNLLNTGLCCFATLSGYQIVGPFDSDSQGLTAEDALTKVKSGYTIEHEGSKISLSLEEMNRFENHIYGMIENELKLLFSMKGGN